MTKHFNADAGKAIETATKIPNNLLRSHTELFESLPKAEERAPYIVAYIRRSKKGENHSVERQKERANEYCQRRFGTNVHKFYTDKGRSGKFRNRQGLRELKADVEAGIVTLVIVEELDRLGRTMAIIAGECQFFADNNVAVHSVKKGDEIGTADIALNGFMATESLTLLLQRSRAGVNEMLDEGGITARAFGYNIVPGKPGERTIDEKLRPIIEWMFQARLDGMGYAEIARILNEYDPPLRKNPFYSHGIQYMLSNSLYAGIFIYGKYKCTRDPKTDSMTFELRPHSEWKVVEVPQLQIIPVELYDAVYPTLAVKPIRPRVGLSLLSCKVFLGTDKRVSSYDARDKVFKKRDANAVICPRVSSEWLSSFVLECIRGVLGNDHLAASFQARVHEAYASMANGLGNLREEKEAQLASVEEQLATYLDREVAGKYPPAFVAKRIAALSGDFEKLTAQLKVMPAKPKAPVLDKARRMNLLDAFDSFVERVRAADFMLRGLDATDLQIAETIRGMIQEVRGEAIPGSNSLTCSLVLNLGKVMCGVNLPTELASETVTFEKIYHVMGMAGDLAGFQAALDRRIYALSDHEYDVLMSDHGTAISGALSPEQFDLLRQALDLQFALMSLSRSWRSFAEHAQAPNRLTCFQTMRQLFRAKLWKGMLHTIETRLPDRYRQLNVDIKDTLLMDLKHPTSRFYANKV
jgi:DNA invertase Pin-like site-specific DNA recombinase